MMKQPGDRPWWCGGGGFTILPQPRSRRAVQESPPQVRSCLFLEAKDELMCLFSALM